MDNNRSSNDPHDINVVAIASFSIVAALLSLVGAGSVLVCSIYHRRVLYPEIFPTFHLAVADLLASLSVIISSALFLSDLSGSYGAGLLCSIVSGLITSFYTSAFLLTVVYALEVLVRFRGRLKDGASLDSLLVTAVSSRQMYFAYAFSWLTPLVLGVVAITKTYNEVKHTERLQSCSLCLTDFRFDGDICWQGAQGQDLSSLHDLVRLVFLVPLVLVMATNMVLYVLIWRTYRHVVIRSGLLSYHQRQEERLLRKKTYFYQSVFFVCWIPAIIVGFASFGEDYTLHKYYPGLVIQVILGPLQGLMNSIVYGWKRDSFRRALTERASLLSTNRTAMIFSRNHESTSGTQISPQFVKSSFQL